MNLRRRPPLPSFAASLALALLVATLASLVGPIAGCGSSDPTVGYHQTAGEGEDPGSVDAGSDARD